MKYIVCLWAGVIIGFLIATFFKGAKESDPVTREPEPRCKTNIMKECGDQCCSFCLGATECRYACKLHPGKCGQVVKVH